MKENGWTERGQSREANGKFPEWFWRENVQAPGFDNFKNKIILVLSRIDEDLDPIELVAPDIGEGSSGSGEIVSIGRI